MIDEKEKIASAIMRHADPDAVIALYHALANDRADRLFAEGYEVVDADHGSASVIAGGQIRPVVWSAGKAWALRPDIHAKRLADAMAQAKQRDAAIAAQQASVTASQPASPTTCTALIDGQLCGGSLIMAPVCPRCALGKSGVAATLTCDVCGHVSC